MNCKETECMVISKRKSLSYELRTRNTKIKGLQKFKYLGNVLAEDGRCDT